MLSKFSTEYIFKKNEKYVKLTHIFSKNMENISARQSAGIRNEFGKDQACPAAPSSERGQ